jgi:hypothetical protein
VIGDATQCRAGLAMVQSGAGYQTGAASGFQAGSAAMTALGAGAVAAVAGVGAYQVDKNRNDRENPSISR